MKEKVTLAQHLASKPRGYASELAKRLKTNKVYLSQMKVGTRMPGVAMVIAIQEAEGIELDIAEMRKVYLEAIAERSRKRRGKA